MLGRAAGPARTSERPGPAGGEPSAFLRVALVGPTEASAGRIARHTVELAHQLSKAGHDVTLVSWSTAETDKTETSHWRGAAGTAIRTSAAGTGSDVGTVGPPPFLRTVRSLARNRPDTWVRTGQRLREYDTVVLVHTGPATVPMHLALLRAAGAGRSSRAIAVPSAPKGVLVCDAVLPARAGVLARSLVSAALGRVDGVLVHRREEAQLAAQLGATRVYAVEVPGAPPQLSSTAPRAAVQPVVVAAAPTRGVEPSPGGDRLARFGPLPADLPIAHLTAPWAAYVGAIEALAAPDIAAADLEDRGLGGAEPDDEPDVGGSPRGTPTGRLGRTVGAIGSVLSAMTPRVIITRADLPDWLEATDVLDDAGQADEARDEARRLGLPRCRDGVAAWAALGALGAIIRLADDGRRVAVVVEESGARSPLTRWARAVGFAPVDLGLTAEGYDFLEVDAGSLDVVARLHPRGCDASDIDEAVAQASWALRPGGLLLVTVPLGRPGTELALGPAEVRGVIARAHDVGFVLVGDIDGETGRRMRAARAAAVATTPRTVGAAYGLMRLTLRRR